MKTAWPELVYDNAFHAGGGLYKLKYWGYNHHISIDC